MRNAGEGDGQNGCGDAIALRWRPPPAAYSSAPLSLDAVRKILLHGALRHRKDAGQNLAYPPTNLLALV